MRIESVNHMSDSDINICYRDDSKFDGGIYNVYIYVENDQIMVKSENTELVVTTAPFED